MSLLLYPISAFGSNDTHGRDRRSTAWDHAGMLPTPLIAAVMIVAILALIPTRRLYLAGWGTGVLLGYFLGLVILAAIVVEVRGLRLLVPLLIVAYLVPFMTPGRGIARLFGLRPQRDPEPPAEPRRVGPEVIEPPRDVPPTPPERRSRFGIRRE